MCCDNKCFFFIKVRTGSLIFAYINAVITGFGVLGLLCGMDVMITNSLNDNNYFNWQVLWSFIYVSVCFVQVTAAFTCTVLLLFGIHENKPALVKTYVIYGMIQLTILIGVMITLFIVTVPVAGVLVFLGCCIYLLNVYMVYLTHKGMITPERNSFLNPLNVVMA